MTCKECIFKALDYLHEWIVLQIEMGQLALSLDDGLSELDVVVDLLVVQMINGLLWVEFFCLSEKAFLKLMVSAATMEELRSIFDLR